jgi:hypothetical protein
VTKAEICADWHGHWGLLKAAMLHAGVAWWRVYQLLPMIRASCPI